MKIKLTKNTLYNEKGTVKNVNPAIGKQLIKEGRAELVLDKPKATRTKKKTEEVK